ncbi:MAG: class I SAM-dependent methyltransferase [Candidatus Zixiibacteriota bacterium]|nr:MAG: class I SAM-dependent methyltransferase [candidate division Zixibacteria bacterium]
MIDQGKWAVAQANEKKHWVRNRERYASDQAKRTLRLKAERSERWISQFVELKDDSRIMEIGGAGEPVIDFFSKGSLTSLDPLNDFYSEQFSNLLNPDVRRIKAAAEDIPFGDRFFDLIMVHNVLDHTRDPSKVICETSRCLKTGGIMVLSVNTFPIYWAWGRKFLPLLGAQDHLLHPHSFSVGKVLRMIRRTGFEILEAKLDLFVPRRWEDQRISPMRRRVYSLLNYRRQRVSIIAGKPI